VAFGFSGIYDADEAERIRDMSDTPAIVPLQHQKPVDHQKMAPVLEKLVSRALAQNAWSAAYQYIESRFSGSELEYASQYLQEKELGSLDVPKQLEQVEEVQAQEAEIAETVADEQEPPTAQADEENLQEQFF
jgi:hypothetical protein